MFGNLGDSLVNVSEEGSLGGCIGAFGGVGCPQWRENGMGGKFLATGLLSLRIWTWPFFKDIVFKKFTV